MYFSLERWHNATFHPFRDPQTSLVQCLLFLFTFLFTYIHMFVLLHQPMTENQKPSTKFLCFDLCCCHNWKKGRNSQTSSIFELLQQQKSNQRNLLFHIWLSVITKKETDVIWIFNKYLGKTLLQKINNASLKRP